eukprot:795724-Pyramimonas_sp.AAC.1
MGSCVGGTVERGEREGGRKVRAESREEGRATMEPGRRFGALSRRAALLQRGRGARGAAGCWIEVCGPMVEDRG